MWRSEFRLRPGDLDGLGHLTASAYLVLFEDTRSAWMVESLDVVYPNYVVATQQIDYLREVTPSDVGLTVELAVQEVGTSSFVVVEHLTTSGVLCARSTATLVMWDLSRRRSRVITPDERAVFEAYQGEPACPRAP